MLWLSQTTKHKQESQALPQHENFQRKARFKYSIFENEVFDKQPQASKTQINNHWIGIIGQSKKFKHVWKK